MRVKAIMWDGINKLQGELIIENGSLKFEFLEFADSDLTMSLSFSEIQKISFESIYGLDPKALKVQSRNGKSNLFIVNNPSKIKFSISQKIKEYQNNNLT